MNDQQWEYLSVNRADELDRLALKKIGVTMYDDHGDELTESAVVLHDQTFTKGYQEVKEGDWYLYKEFRCSWCGSKYTYEVGNVTYVTGKNRIEPACPVCHKNHKQYRTFFHSVFRRA